MKKALLVAALLGASAGAHAAWVTTVVGAPSQTTLPSGISVAGHVAGGLDNGTGINSFVSGPTGLQIINPPSGTTDNTAIAVNASGHVVGYYGKSDGNTYAYLYSNGGMTEIALTGYSTAAQFINHIGQVAGQAYTFGIPANGIDTQGFLYSRGVLTLVSMGGARTAILGLNASGQVVGFGTTPAGDHAFLHSNGVTTDLGTFPGAFTSAAVAINDAGQVAGYSTIAGNEGVTHAFRYSDGVMTDLGTLGGETSAALALSNAGLVIGYSNITPQGDFHGFVSDGEHMTDLGTLGGNWSYPTGINSAGQIVGTTGLASGQSVPFLYENGTMVNVASLVTGMTDIDSTVFLNEAGQIAGTGRVNGKAHAFLLTWVPDGASAASAPQTASLSLQSTSLQSDAIAPQSDSTAVQTETTGKQSKPATATPHGKAVRTFMPVPPGLKCAPPTCVSPGNKH